MNFTVINRPVVEPITLQEAKDHLRVDDDLEDALISELIFTARSWCEQFLLRDLITQTQLLYIDGFDCQSIDIKANLQGVTTVKYLDSDGVQQTLADTEYVVDTVSTVGRIMLAYGSAWPATYPELNAVEIEFDVGYGLAIDVPAPIRSAMLLLVGHYYLNRESVTVGVSVVETPQAVPMLLDFYRVMEA